MNNTTKESSDGRSRKENTRVSDDISPEKVVVTPDIKRSVADAQILVAYLAYEAAIDIDDETVNTFIKAKYLMQQNKWTPEAEAEFLTKYDKMAKIIAPVTIESLRSSMPASQISDLSTDKKKSSSAEKAVFRYRTGAIISLLVLLVAQIYWIMGAGLREDLKELSEKRTQVVLEIVRLKKLKNYDEFSRPDNDPEMIRLENDSETQRQLFDSNYELLQDWNSVWQAVLLNSVEFKEEMTPYVREKHEREMSLLEEEIKELKEELEEIKELREELNEGFFPDEKVREEKEKLLAAKEKERKYEKLRIERDKAANKLFVSQVAADYVLNALQVYFLPLLYGLLGAATYVLRTLSMEIKTLIYSYDSEIRFRLRLSLGALGGMAIGWFLKPDDADALASLSPMAIAFLVGYNVEVLFAVMDKFIEIIMKWSQSKPNKPKPAKPVKSVAPAKKEPAAAS